MMIATVTATHTHAPKSSVSLKIGDTASAALDGLTTVKKASSHFMMGIFAHGKNLPPAENDAHGVE